MTTLTSPLPLAATASIIASAWASGAGAAISFFTITPILQSSAPREVLLQQWHLAYNLGKSYMPPAAGAIAASYLGVAWTVAKHPAQYGGGSGEWRGFAAAAALMVGIVPFTLLFIMRTIRELEGLMIAGDAKDTDSNTRESDRDEVQAMEEARRLLTRWSRLNFARAMLPLIGTGFAVWNLSKVLSA
ncbi:hypothetical protein PFICI_09288 [Pestalotiopsis fici W106-1]|uniref:DUF1772 domain-containing protein n=1 Tax=Pestalotiopsis fici (strain W106-1 / CGMCC3.15140) TaxID=1229662 RepID=W3X010_PESFW|nr:uncharacterized protein PFICI_09288 [Pestalotiopsis fici W106-1]ETS79435.1 hypothetical protein PFICI_09288 [Pestalotiopsis fici W106-1]